MDNRIKHLLEQIAQLEEELRITLRDPQANDLFQIKGKRIEFKKAVRQAHRRLKTGFFRWLLTNRPQNLITGPIIYSMIVPLVVLDLFVSFYQATCFPIYRIPKLRREDFIVFDRQKLEYLNFIEKFHCAYASGLVAYVTAIIGKTEAYFCPIKHARHILGTHSRYRSFLDYGEAADYGEKLEQSRRTLNEEEKR